MSTTLEKIIHAGPLRESLWLYTFSAAMRIFIGMLRVLCLTWLIMPEKMGLWGTAIMGIVVLGPIANMGFSQGLTRFVSVYEADGKLKWFFRRAFLGSIAVAVCVCGIMFFFRGLLADILYPPEIGYVYQRELITGLVIGNVFMMGCFTCLLGLMNGLRVYRLMSLIEVGFSLLFTVVLLILITMSKSVAMMLLVHLCCQMIVFVVGVFFLIFAVNRISRDHDASQIYESTDFKAVNKWRDLLGQLGRFGVLALAGALAWQLVTYASYYLSFVKYGPAIAGEFNVTLRLAQPLYTLALASWAVGYAHVARLNQQGQVQRGEKTLDMFFRLISWPLQICGCLMIFTASLWVKVLGEKYQVAPDYINGLIMLFVTMSNVLLLGTVSKVRGKLMSFVLAAFAGMVFNVLFFYREIFGCDIRYMSSMSAGAGVWAGALFVTIFYISRWRVKLSLGSWVLLILPAVYILPGGVYLSAGVLVIGLLLKMFFSSKETGELVGIARSMLGKNKDS